MKKLLLLIFFLPLIVSAQDSSGEESELNRNAIKVRLLTTLFSTKNLNVGYQRELDNISALEVELFYTLGFSEDFADESFSHVLVELQSGVITGGINIFAKHHFGKNSHIYGAYGLGYFRYNYLKSHTVCTEVGNSVGGLCPCLNFIENRYKRNVNQWSSELRIGIEPPFLKSLYRFRFDLFLGIGGRIMSVAESGYLSHQYCTDDLSHIYTTEVLPRNFNRSTKFTAEGEETFVVYPIAGVKLAYAF